MINYVITLLFLLISSKANILCNDVNWFIIMLFIFGFGISQKGFLQNCLNIFGVFSSVYLFFIIFRNYLINHLGIDFVFSDLIFAFKFIFLSYMLVAILKDTTLIYIVKVMTHLTLVSLFFYSIQLLGFGDLIFNFSEKLNISPAWSLEGHTNFIIFTYTKVLHEFRNSGFVWEPGAFGCFLVITLLFNFFINNFRIDKKAIILIVGIISTLSTTSYIALLVLLLMLYRYRFPTKYASLIIIISAGIIVIIALPFLADKILAQSNSDLVSLDDIETLSKYYEDIDDQIPLGRFASAEFLYGNLNSQLFLGVSNAYNIIVNNIYNVNISNGLFDFIAKFGLVGLFVLIFYYSKFCIHYIFKKEYVFYCILALLVLGFGEPVLHLPFFLTFLFLPTLIKESIQVEENTFCIKSDIQDEKNKNIY